MYIHIYIYIYLFVYSFNHLFVYFFFFLFTYMFIFIFTWIFFWPLCRVMQFPLVNCLNHFRLRHITLHCSSFYLRPTMERHRFNPDCKSIVQIFELSETIAPSRQVYGSWRRLTPEDSWLRHTAMKGRLAKSVLLAFLLTVTMASETCRKKIERGMEILRTQPLEPTCQRVSKLFAFWPIAPRMTTAFACRAVSPDPCGKT